MTALVPLEKRDDDLDTLRSRLTDREAQLRDRDAEVAQATADLAMFKFKYRQRVGTLHDELDRLELAIAEAELGEISKKLEDSPGSPNAAAADAAPEPAPRFTSDAVRKLFRDVAKAIHPDYASDEAARDRRHALMVEANRAYASGDEEQLRLILQAWEKSPEAIQGTDPEAIRLRLVRRITQIDEQLQILTSELAALTASPIWELKAMVDEAAARGKDLVRDMVVRLRRDIMVATNRLDAMRPSD